MKSNKVLVIKAADVGLIKPTYILVCCHSCAGRNPVSLTLFLTSYIRAIVSKPVWWQLPFASPKGNLKTTTLPLAFGFPIVRVKMGKFETRLAAQTRLSLSIFCLAQLAVSEVEKVKVKVKINSKSKSKSKSKKQKQSKKQNIYCRSEL